LGDRKPKARSEAEDAQREGRGKSPEAVPDTGGRNDQGNRRIALTVRGRIDG